MIIEIYEALAHERSDEDILVDGLLEELIEAGHSVIRHDPAAEPEAFEAPQIVELLETYALPYFFKDGSLCFTGSYDLNGLNRKISCGGCLGGGCSEEGRDVRSRRAAAPGALIRRAAAKDAEAEPNGRADAQDARAVRTRRPAA